MLYKVIRNIIRWIYSRWKFRGKVILSNNAIVSLNSEFEGMSQIFSNVRFHGKLGYGSYIGNHCSLSADIGRFASIAPYVRCNSGTHPYSFPFATTAPCFFSLNSHAQNGSTFATEQLYDEFSLYDRENKIAVKIGSDCWIGQGAFIVGGITIGNGAVVLAHAVVTKDVPDYAIVGGVPAKIIRYRYDDETIKFLQKIKWWNNNPEWFKKNWRLLSDIENLKRYYSTSEIENVDI